MSGLNKYPDKITYIEEDFRFSELGRRYYYKETITDAVSLPVRLPINERNVIVILNAAGNAKVQYTISPDKDIIDDKAIWVDWPQGLVSGVNVDAAHGSITALRLESIGETKWEISI